MHVSTETMILLGSIVPTGAGESKIGSKGICGGEGGTLAGSAGTGGKYSELGGEHDLSEGRRLSGGDVTGAFSSIGIGGGARVGRDGVEDRDWVRSLYSCSGSFPSSSSSSSKSGIGGNGGLVGDAGN